MIAENLASVKTKIAEACARRSPALNQPVKLVAVSKNWGFEVVNEALKAGVVAIGENRVQEALAKFPSLTKPVEKHLIGHLQTNKAKLAVEHFDLIHSIDSLRILEAVNDAAKKIDKRQDILLEINLAGEATKTGAPKEDLPSLLKATETLSNVRLKGLMFVAPNCENKEELRPLFRNMYALFINLKSDPPSGADIDCLSMGMSHDYEIAIEEGSNMVRIGTAIFGARNYE